MSKPSDEEVDIAIKTAIQIREKDMDSFFVAKTLLSHNYRIGYLEEVFKAADQYLNMGMNERQRKDLWKAIKKAKEAESYTSHQNKTDFGLE